MLQGDVSSTIPLAVELAPWFAVGLSWVVSAVVLAAVGFLAICGFIWAGQRLSESAREALRRLEAFFREQRGTGVPALTTLIAGVGAALSGVFLSPPVGCGVAIVCALITFAFESLAQDSGARARFARWLFAFGSVLPFGVIIGVSIATGGFGDLDPEMMTLGIGGTVLGALGVASGLVAFWESKSVTGTD